MTALTGRTVFLMWMTCELVAIAQAGQSADSPDARRVRSDSAVIVALLESGSRGSATFKELVLAIEGTDGVVYVRAGKCPGYRIKGCLLHTMLAAVWPVPGWRQRVGPKSPGALESAASP